MSSLLSPSSSAGDDKSEPPRVRFQKPGTPRTQTGPPPRAVATPADEDESDQLDTLQIRPSKSTSSRASEEGVCSTQSADSRNQRRGGRDDEGFDLPPLIHQVKRKKGVSSGSTVRGSASSDAARRRQEPEPPPAALAESKQPSEVTKLPSEVNRPLSTRSDGQQLKIPFTPNTLLSVLSTEAPSSVGQQSPLYTPIHTPSWRMNAWANERTAGGTPVLFRGNKEYQPSKKEREEMKARGSAKATGASKEEKASKDYQSLTDSLLADDFDTRLFEEIEADLTEDIHRFDRNWYDADEVVGLHDLHAWQETDQSLQEREDRLLKDQLRQREKKATVKQAMRSRDQELWELNRMSLAGVGGRREISSDLTVSDEEQGRTHVLVREVKPPFLAEQESVSFQTQAVVSTVRDATSDMAVLARKGSTILKHLREQQDKSQLRERFWELQGSFMGSMMGLQAKKGVDGPDEDVEGDFRADSQFAELLKNQKQEAQSIFAATKTIEEQRKSLPVYAVRDDILQLLREHSVLIVIGETGSGKTTQITQYMLESGWAMDGIIACTQPRRVAAVSVAKRVADEQGSDLGAEVGYAIRFEDCTSASTRIKYMTDGVLLRESLQDTSLDRYATVIMDEAHERSLNTDVLFGVLRQVLAQRRDFRLIVTSATMEADRFSAFFGGAPVFEIPGRTFPVQIEYTRTPVDDYLDATVQKALQVHCNNADVSGDILIFMTGQEDIECCCYLLAERASGLSEKMPPIAILPIYSQLPSDLQAKVFAPHEHRKVIVATNIAETSLTLDGVRFVVDAGYCKLKVFNPKMGMDALQITPISQANARQRSGRAGRTGPGICYRLYTERAYLSEMLSSTVPEIQRTNLANVVLLLKSLGIKDLLQFAFMDPPPVQTIMASLYQLWVLGALDNLGEITKLGRDMVQFPIDPPLSKMLLASAQMGCSAEILIIVSMLSVPSIFVRPKDRAEESDAARERFFVPESDHLSLLNVFQQWRRHNYGPQWAGSHFLQQKSLKKAREIRAQLLDQMQSQKIPHESCGADWEVARKAICSGYFHNAGKLRGIGEYVNLRSSVTGHLHPTSALFSAGTTPEYIVYHEVIMTMKEYLSHVTAVEPEWLAEMGPMFFFLKKTGGTGIN